MGIVCFTETEITLSGYESGMMESFKKIDMSLGIL